MFEHSAAFHVDIQSVHICIQRGIELRIKVSAELMTDRLTEKRFFFQFTQTLSV